MKTKLLKYAVKNILRNKFLSLSTILVLSLLMFFVNILAVVHDLSFWVIDKINEKLTISLYLKDWITDKSSWVIDLKSKISNFSSEIKVDYISKEEALRDFLEKSWSDFNSVLQWENPLPWVLKISNIDIEEHDKINEIVSNKTSILDGRTTPNTKQVDYKGQFNTIKTITPALQNFQIWIYILIAIFIFSIWIIIYSIISNFIFFFKDEIYITNLVWWARNFVYWPFMIQGAIYSVLALTLWQIIFFLMLNNIDYLFIDKSTSFVKLINTNFVLLFLLELVVFSLLGASSGYFSSRKYIKTL